MNANGAKYWLYEGYVLHSCRLIQISDHGIVNDQTVSPLHREELHFFFNHVSGKVSPWKEYFHLLCVGVCSLACVPATAIKSLCAETFLFLEFVCLLSPLGETFFFFQSIEDFMHFSSQLLICGT